MYSAKGFKGNVSGIATGATKVKTTAAGNSNTYYLPMVQSNTAQDLEDLQTGAHIKYVRGTNAATSTLTIDGSVNIVGDLEIQGSNTITNIESTQVDIADARIRLSYSDSFDFLRGTSVGSGRRYRYCYSQWPGCRNSSS